MGLEVSIVLIMMFIIIYVAIINIFSIFFRMTGLTKEKAKFQSISLFTAVGFTTKESELITSDRRRRKVATGCMIVGNIFSLIIVSLVVNVISNLNVEAEKRTLIIIGCAFGAFLVIMLLFQIPAVKKLFAKIIEFFVIKSFNKDKEENFLTLLDNYGDSAIVEIYLNKLPEIFSDKSIFESGLKKDFDINILMLKRKGRVITVKRDTMIQPHDEIVVFGSYQKIKSVFLVKNKVRTEELTEDSNEVELIDNYESMAMANVRINVLPEVMCGKSIEECKLKPFYGINILMIKRENKAVEVNRNTTIAVGDEITVFGPLSNIKYLFLNFGRPIEEGGTGGQAEEGTVNG